MVSSIGLKRWKECRVSLVGQTKIHFCLVDALYIPLRNCRCWNAEDTRLFVFACSSEKQRCNIMCLGALSIRRISIHFRSTRFPLYVSRWLPSDAISKNIIRGMGYSTDGSST